MVRNYLSIKRWLTIGLLWVSGIMTSNALSPKEDDTVTFMLVTDPHVCNLSGYHPFFVEKRKHFGNGIKTFPDFIKSVPGKYNADFLVVAGDNIDYYEAETDNKGMLDTQVEQYSRLIDLSPVPVYLILGNHDITTYSTAQGPVYLDSQINAERARAAWMRNASCFKEGTYYSRIFKIDSVTLRLIFLDNAYYATEEFSDGELPFIIDQSQLLWLDDQLKTSASDIELIFMHIPLPYRQSVNSEILSEPLSAYSSKTSLFNLFDVIERNPSTGLIFASHLHINSINNYILPDNGILTQVLTGAFGYNTNNWRVIKITKNEILVSFPGSPGTEYSVPVRF